MDRLLFYYVFLFVCSGCNSSDSDKPTITNLRDSVSKAKQILGASNTYNSTVKLSVQSDIAKSNTHCDSLKRDSIYTLAKTLKYSMEHKYKFSNEEAVVLLKVYNSLHVVNTISKPITKAFAYSFVSLFRKKYLIKIIEQIGYTYGVGMTIYCPKYDIHVSPSMYTRCKDYYTVY